MNESMDLEALPASALRDLDSEVIDQQLREGVRREMRVRGLLAREFRIEVIVFRHRVTVQFLSNNDDHVYAEDRDLDSLDEAIEYIEHFVSQQR